MALSTGKCITVHTIINNDGNENHEKAIVTIPKALMMLFSFDLTHQDCRFSVDTSMLRVTEYYRCGIDIRTYIFTGTEDDMKTLLWAKDLLFATHNWVMVRSVNIIEQMFQANNQQVNAYPLYRRIEGRSHRSSEGSESRPEKTWLIYMYTCGVFDQDDHDAVIVLLKPTGRWKGWRFVYREDILVSLLECKSSKSSVGLLVCRSRTQGSGTR